MTARRVWVGSTEFIELRVFGNVPFTDFEAPRIAFVRNNGGPTVNDWQLSDWTDATRVEDDGGYSRPLRVLIGPNSENGAMTEGTYRVWMQIFGTPEVPSFVVDSLVITES